MGAAEADSPLDTASHGRRWVLARTVLLFPAVARAAALLQRDGRDGPSGPGGRPEA